MGFARKDVERTKMNILQAEWNLKRLFFWGLMKGESLKPLERAIFLKTSLDMLHIIFFI